MLMFGRNQQNSAKAIILQLKNKFKKKDAVRLAHQLQRTGVEGWGGGGDPTAGGFHHGLLGLNFK